LITERALTVYLEVPFETIWKRIGPTSNRPLAIGRSRSELEALLDERRARYEQASHRVDADRRPDVIVDEVLKLWNA
jgi:shikimate kinase